MTSLPIPPVSRRLKIRFLWSIVATLAVAFGAAQWRLVTAEEAASQERLARLEVERVLVQANVVIEAQTQALKAAQEAIQKALVQLDVQNIVVDRGGGEKYMWRKDDGSDTPVFRVIQPEDLPIKWSSSTSFNTSHSTRSLKIYNPRAFVQGALPLQITAGAPGAPTGVQPTTVPLNITAGQPSGVWSPAKTPGVLKVEIVDGSVTVTGGTDEELRHEIIRANTELRGRRDATKALAACRAELLKAKR